MAAIKTLANIRKARRSMRLRDESLSDDQLVEIMETMINEAIIAQASGNDKMVKRSIDELRQVRKDVRTGNVSLSSNSKQTQIIGRFSHLIDQLEDEDVQTKQEIRSNSGLLDNLPSAETFISAVMTSNPLLGYSAKVLKDIGGTVAQSKKAHSEAAKRQAKILEENRDYILGKQQELEIESDLNDQKKEELSHYDMILENIENELVKLRMIWEGDDTNQNEVKISDDSSLVKVTEENSNKLSKLVEAENRIIEEQRLQREQDEFDAIEKRRLSEADSTNSLLSKEDSEGGLLGGLVEGIGEGLMRGITGVLGIFKSIGTIGLKLLGLGVKGSVIGAVIMSIYNFIDGFFNAGDILEMDETDLSIKDRLIAGFGNVWGQLIKLFDTVLEWFGIDLIDSEDMEKKIAQKTKILVDDFFSWVFGLFDNVSNFIQDFDIGETIDFIKQKSIDFMNNLVEVIPNMVSDAFDKVGELFGNASDWLFGSDDEDEMMTPEQKERLENFRTQRSYGYSGSTNSSMMPEAMSDVERLSYGNTQTPSSAVVAGNNNTNVYNNRTEVHNAPNVNNPDETFRNKNLENISRMRFS